MFELWNGDCLEEMGRIPDGSVDMVLCDPPYGTTACKWDAVIPFEPMWAHLKRVTKKNGAIVMTASQPFTSALVMSNPDWFRYCWVWHKTRPSNFPLAKKQPMKYHEDVVVFGVKPPPYYPQMIPGDKIRKKGTNEGYRGFNKGLENPEYLDKEYKDFYPGSIQTFPHHNANMMHPTQKPVALMEYLIKTYTNEGETVLDFTMGSGTTGVACANLNRGFIGIEKDPGYFKIASDRIGSAVLFA
jgi:site-specific DNA-methyltransferase (adenine-specific)